MEKDAEKKLKETQDKVKDNPKLSGLAKDLEKKLEYVNKPINK